MGAAVAGRIRTFYGRPAEVIPLGLESAWFSQHVADEHFLVVSRLVEQKRIDLAIEACAAAGVSLVIAGTGREEPRLRRMSGPDVRFAGHISDARLRELYARAAAVIVPAEEDFGLVPLEAQAAGTPVVAFDAGGVRDTVVDGVTGIRFAPQTTGALTEAIREAAARSWDHGAISLHAATFKQADFKARFEVLVSTLRPGREAAGRALVAGGGDAV